MKIQFLNGGLANQSFQYIFARYYELSYPGEIMYMDDSYFALHTVHNGYELEKVFGIKPHMLSECFEESVWSFILEERKRGKSIPQILQENQIKTIMVSEVGEEHKTFNPFDGPVYAVSCNEYLPAVLDVNYAPNIYYHGYWLNKNWFEKFRDVFLQEFHFPQISEEWNLRYMEQIQSSRSVSLHVRRGDYIALDCACPADLYQIFVKKFLRQARGDWHCFVFSDDIPWCKEHMREMGLNRFQEVIFVEGNMDGRNYRDLQLMTMCKGMIISNSSFCYLAALLNTVRQEIFNPTPREL